MLLSQDRYSPCLVVKLTKASRHPGAWMKNQIERIEATCKFRRGQRVSRRFRLQSSLLGFSSVGGFAMQGPG